MNIIVIVTDSLRADHCGCYPMCQSYNGGRVATPNLDRLAADGTQFRHAYAESLPTLPTRTTWWTGRVTFPFRGWQTFENWDYLLAEVLWDKGFTSALFADTYHMHKPTYNCGRGFDTVGWVRGQEYDPWIVDDRPVDVSKWHKLKGDESDDLWRPRFEQYLRNRSMLKKEEDWFSPQLTKKAIQWLDEQVRGSGRRDNLFLWMDYFTPHEPWDPPEPYWSMYKDPNYRGQDIIDPVAGPVEGYLSRDEVQRIKSLYAGEVTFVDKWAGILLDHLRDLGIYDDSLIVWLTDHGEPFAEHGIIRKARPWNYEELVRIPWVMKLPESLKSEMPSAPSRTNALVQQRDLMPTILDALKVPTPLPLVARGPRAAGAFPQDLSLASDEIHLHGQSLLPLLKGEVDKLRDYAYCGHHRQSWSIQNHEWRYQLFVDGSQPSELFHRPEDPYDQENVIAAHKEVAEKMELDLRRWVASLALK